MVLLMFFFCMVHMLYDCLTKIRICGTLLIIQLWLYPTQLLSLFFFYFVIWIFGIQVAFGYYFVPHSRIRHTSMMPYGLSETKSKPFWSLWCLDVVTDFADENTASFSNIYQINSSLFWWNGIWFVVIFITIYAITYYY